MQPDHYVFPRPSSKYTISLRAGESEEGLQSRMLAQRWVRHTPKSALCPPLQAGDYSSGESEQPQKKGIHLLTCMCVLFQQIGTVQKSVLHKTSSPAKDSTHARRTFHLASIALLSDVDNHQRMTDTWGRVCDVEYRIKTNRKGEG